MQRLRMISQQQQERKNNMLKDKAFLEQRMKNDAEFKRGVEEDREKRRACAVDIQNFYKRQTESRKEKTRKEIEKQLELDSANTALLEQEEETFQRYADKVLDDAANNNRCLFPLLKARNEGPGGGRGPKSLGNAGLRPSYMAGDATAVQLPHYFKDEATYACVYGHVGRTSKRLGFNW